MYDVVVLGVTSPVWSRCLQKGHLLRNSEEDCLSLFVFLSVCGCVCVCEGVGVCVCVCVHLSHSCPTAVFHRDTSTLGLLLFHVLFLLCTTCSHSSGTRSGF